MCPDVYIRGYGLATSWFPHRCWEGGGGLLVGYYSTLAIKIVVDRRRMDRRKLGA
jgi:hypothetical protein